MECAIDDICRKYIIEVLTDRHYKTTDLNELSIINKIFKDLEYDDWSVWLTDIYEKMLEQEE